MTEGAKRVLAAIAAAPGIEDDALRTVLEMTSEDLLAAVRELRREQLVESRWSETGDPFLYWFPVRQLELMEGAA